MSRSEHAVYSLRKAVTGPLSGVLVGALLSVAQTPLSAQPDGESAASQPEEVDTGAVRYLRGQLHAHSSQSGDSETPADEVLAWYAEHGFDFVVFTDHNVVTSPPEHTRVLGIPGVELTQNPQTCRPPPEPGLICPLHINALFAEGAGPVRLGPAASLERAAIFQVAIDEARRLGAISQINHPNYHYAADAELLVELSRGGALLLEIANEAWDSNNAGDATHPSTVALWDQALTAGARLYGVATDDAHHYADAAAMTARGERPFTGDRGFVMVRAALDAASIRAAIERGDFYSSNGVYLSRLEAVADTLTLGVEESGPAHRFRLIGEGGRLLVETSGTQAVFRPVDFAGVTRYVRAEVVDEHGRHAWLQPIWLQTSSRTPPEWARVDDPSEALWGDLSGHFGCAGWSECEARLTLCAWTADLDGDGSEELRVASYCDGAAPAQEVFRRDESGHWVAVLEGGASSVRILGETSHGLHTIRLIDHDYDDGCQRVSRYEFNGAVYERTESEMVCP